MASFLRFVFVAISVLLPVALIGPPAHGFAATRHADQPGEIESGRASWYGNAQGRQTASGERFDESAMTAAHRYLPFGTIVRVTNKENGRSVEVRINDRGPWRGGRIIDVSSAAANALDMKRSGIVPVQLEVIRLGSPGRLASAP